MKESELMKYCDNIEINATVSEFDIEGFGEVSKEAQHDLRNGTMILLESADDRGGAFYSYNGNPKLPIMKKGGEGMLLEQMIRFDENVPKEICDFLLDGFVTECGRLHDKFLKLHTLAEAQELIQNNSYELELELE
jgi:hypothetical protein